MRIAFYLYARMQYISFSKFLRAIRISSFIVYQYSKEITKGKEKESISKYTHLPLTAKQNYNLRKH